MTDAAATAAVTAAATLAALRRGDLAGARALRLAGLGLREFPAEILGLAESLELLDLSGNALEALPPGLARCRHLRVFLPEWFLRPRRFGVSGFMIVPRQFGEPHSQM